jgi:hypothetical protein
MVIERGRSVLAAQHRFSLLAQRQCVAALSRFARAWSWSTLLQSSSPDSW